MKTHERRRGLNTAFYAKGNTLFDTPKSHRDDPVTSFIAAEKLAKSGKWTAQQKEVYEALKKRNGGTAGEICCYMAGVGYLNRFVVSRRMPELREKGLVEMGPKRKCGVIGSVCVTWWLAGTEEQGL